MKISQNLSDVVASCGRSWRIIIIIIIIIIITTKDKIKVILNENVTGALKIIHKIHSCYIISFETFYGRFWRGGLF